MQYSDSTNDAGIVEDTKFHLNIKTTDTVSYPIKDITRNVNRALDKVVSLILGADGRWQWDDTNYTDLPIATANLVSGQQDYSFQDDFLTIERVEAKDESGEWQNIRPIDPVDIQNFAMEEFYETNADPLFYDKIANSVFLYPTPSYNSTGGLKVYFQRNADYFTTSDTTKKPGFAPHLHRYLSLSAAFDFAFANDLKKQDRLKAELKEYEKKIVEFYAIRPKDEQIRLTPYQDNWK